MQSFARQKLFSIKRVDEFLKRIILLSEQSNLLSGLKVVAPLRPALFWSFAIDGAPIDVHDAKAKC